MTMVQELEERIKQRVEETRIRIDDYKDTIWAIIGFVNLYFIDDKTHQPRSYVKRFQGRRLTPLATAEQSGQSRAGPDVRPDLGLVIEDNKGILGEVKKNFPKDDVKRAQNIFRQLKRYDQNLTGWPATNKQVQSHEVVLLVHLTVSTYALEFCKEQLSQMGIKFERPFSIIEFSRIPQVQEFFHFRTVLGELTELGEEKRLKYGVQVKMEHLLKEYARTKLYDAEPPLPYLVQQIWFHVVTPVASEDPKFESLRKNQKLSVHLEIEDIVERLDEGFSFRHWHGQDPERQPHIPRKEWVRQACEFLVESGKAEWADGDEKTRIVVFYRNYKDIQDHFIVLHATLEEKRVSAPMLPGFEPTQTSDSG